MGVTEQEKQCKNAIAYNVLRCITMYCNEDICGRKVKQWGLQSRKSNAKIQFFTMHYDALQCITMHYDALQYSKKVKQWGSQSMASPWETQPWCSNSNVHCRRTSGSHHPFREYCHTEFNTIFCNTILCNSDVHCRRPSGFRVISSF